MLIAAGPRDPARDRSPFRARDVAIGAKVGAGRSAADPIKRFALMREGIAKSSGTA